MQIKTYITSFFLCLSLGLLDTQATEIDNLEARTKEAFAFLSRNEKAIYEEFQKLNAKAKKGDNVPSIERGE